MIHCHKHKIDFGTGECPMCIKCEAEEMAGECNHALGGWCKKCIPDNTKTVNETLDDGFRQETFGPLEGGTRNNEGKAQLSMVLEAKYALNGCAAVLEMGAKKYSRGNWRKGLDHHEVVDSLLRHLVEYMSGKGFDEESGLLHVDHILCNALFLAELTRTHPSG